MNSNIEASRDRPIEHIEERARPSGIRKSGA